jgi:hypothetical protein
MIRHLINHPRAGSCSHLPLQQEKLTEPPPVNILPQSCKLDQMKEVKFPLESGKRFDVTCGACYNNTAP